MTVSVYILLVLTIFHTWEPVGTDFFRKAEHCQSVAAETAGTTKCVLYSLDRKATALAGLGQASAARSSPR